MKFLKSSILLSVLCISNISFAGTLENKVNDFKNKFELSTNQKLSDIICGTGGCSIDIVENDIRISTIYFSEDVNQLNNSNKMTISNHDMKENMIINSYIVCLENGECKYFDSSESEKANLAYENGEFLKERKKRNTAAYIWRLSEPVRAPIGYHAKQFYNNNIRPIGNSIGNWGYSYAQGQINQAHHNNYRPR